MSISADKKPAHIVAQRRLTCCGLKIPAVVNFLSPCLDNHLSNAQHEPEHAHILQSAIGTYAHEKTHAGCKTDLLPRCWSSGAAALDGDAAAWSWIKSCQANRLQALKA